MGAFARRRPAEADKLGGVRLGLAESGQLRWDRGNGPGEAKWGTSEACLCGVSGSLGLGVRGRLPSGGMAISQGGPMTLSMGRP